MANESLEPNQIMIQAMANPEAAHLAEGMDEFGIQPTAKHHLEHRAKADNIFIAAEQATQASSQKDLEKLNEGLKATIIVNPNLP